jgi:hypothetical protein
LTSLRASSICLGRSEVRDRLVIDGGYTAH